MSHYLVIQKRRQSLKWRIKLYILLFLLILSAGESVYLLRESPLFKIQEILVTGLENQPREQFLRVLTPAVFKNTLARFLGSENIIAWPKNLPLASLEFASIGVKKDWFNREITIDAQRRERFGILCVSRANNEQIEANKDRIFEDDSLTFEDNSGGERCWWFDEKEGLLIEEAPYTEGQLTLRVDEVSDSERRIGQKILAEPLFINFRKILNSLTDLELNLKNLTLDSVGQEFKIRTTAGFEIIFSLRFDPSKNTLPALQELLAKTPANTIQYIDLRVENKIYLKNR